MFQMTNMNTPMGKKKIALMPEPEWEWEDEVCVVAALVVVIATPL